MTGLLSLRGVTKTYPGQPPLTVLKDVNMSIAAGEDMAVVGPSGSGKTTMLSIMGMLDQPTSGEVWIDGTDVARLSDASRAALRAETIGFVFQQFFLLPTLSAVDNVAEGMLYQGLRRSERRRRAMEALERVGLTPRARHRPGQLSGGEQQRVAIARAIAGGPRLLFADEPTGALDQHSGHMVVDYLQSVVADGTTVIVITHDQSLAARFSRQVSLLDGVIVSDDGQPVADGGSLNGSELMGSNELMGGGELMADDSSGAEPTKRVAKQRLTRPVVKEAVANEPELVEAAVVPVSPPEPAAQSPAPVDQKNRFARAQARVARLRAARTTAGQREVHDAD